MKRKKLNVRSVDMNLKIDYCSYKACKYAVEHWHYSKCMPVGKLLKFGVWEDGKFIGVVIYGRGNNMNIGKSYNINMFEFAELVRVALTTHKASVSKIVSITLRIVKKSTKLKLLISYADPLQKHLGTIYQAMNWIYVGESGGSVVYKLNGKIYHSRVAPPGAKQFGKRAKGIDINKAEKIRLPAKHKYLYPLNKDIRKQIEKLKKPYPKKLADIV